jgi:hypothetical protein
VRRFIAILILFAFIFIVPPASGATKTVSSDIGIQSCSQAYIILWEHVGYNGRGLRVCYGVNIPNLAAYGFNDITSSAQYRELSLNTTACVYTEPSYVILLKKFTVNEDAQWFLFGNDAISSVRFGC